MDTKFRVAWRSPEYYAQIVKAGLDGAKALAQDKRLRVAADAYIRIDIVLAAYEKVGAAFDMAWCVKPLMTGVCVSMLVQWMSNALRGE